MVFWGSNDGVSLILMDCRLFMTLLSLQSSVCIHQLMSCGENPLFWASSLYGIFKDCKIVVKKLIRSSVDLPSCTSLFLVSFFFAVAILLFSLYCFFLLSSVGDSIVDIIIYWLDFIDSLNECLLIRLI